MTPSLDVLLARGVISRLDAHLGKALARIVPGTPPEVMLAAALASRAVRLGHVCVDLEAMDIAPPPGAEEEDAALPPLELPSQEELVRALSQSPLVADAAAPAEPRPLVLAAGKRLYLHRYHRYEERLIRDLAPRARAALDVDEPALREALTRLFPSREPDLREPDKQRLAAVIVALRSFAVLSGGPGTGKTYTVTKLLALLAELARKRGESLRVLLLAPTGKAAQRLAESIQRNVGALPTDDAIKAAIPREASTIHRALGFRPDAPTKFRHDSSNPLSADLVLVDEASMVDLALMAKLVDAVPRGARLVLVGDKDQLASVEAGAILGDIYGQTKEDGYSADLANRVERLTGSRVRRSERVRPGIHDSRVHLTVSRRYAAGSGIEALARAVNDGDGARAIAAVREQKDVALHDVPPGPALETALGRAALGVFRGITSLPAEERLARLERFRILCAHRKGKLGVVAVNAFVERFLVDHGAVGDGGEWYDGRPILVTENDYQLDLFNGDVGIVCRSPDSELLEACFPDPQGKELRRIPPSRLPPHETVFAMTVHKSQGSEFDHVALVLPERDSRVLTRELLYTGVTRGKTRVDVFGTESVLAAGVARRVQRASGLGEGLWGLD